MKLEKQINEHNTHFLQHHIPHHTYTMPSTPLQFTLHTAYVHDGAYVKDELAEVMLLLIYIRKKNKRSFVVIIIYSKERKLNYKGGICVHDEARSR